jgi:hypothetical protein
LVTLGGRGAIEWTSGSCDYRQGECWFIPANLGEFSVAPQNATSILRAYVPVISQIRDELSRHGVPNSAIKQVLFI